MSQCEQYEHECRAIREENAVLLSEFVSWLGATGLSASAIKRHRFNVGFYINEFLLHEDAIRPQNGAGEVGVFLGYWFIRKAMWASETSIKSNAASLKKFYTFMCGRGVIDQEELQSLKEQIKEELPEWIATVRRYNDPDIKPEDVWGF